MGTKRKPTLEDAGRIIFNLTFTEHGHTPNDWDNLVHEAKKRYVKMALEIWREVEKCI